MQLLVKNDNKFPNVGSFMKNGIANYMNNSRIIAKKIFTDFF